MQRPWGPDPGGLGCSSNAAPDLLCSPDKSLPLLGLGFLTSKTRGSGLMMQHLPHPPSSNSLRWGSAEGPGAQGAARSWEGLGWTEGAGPGPPPHYCRQRRNVELHSHLPQAVGQDVLVTDSQQPGYTTWHHVLTCHLHSLATAAAVLGLGAQGASQAGEKL